MGLQMSEAIIELTRARLALQAVLRSDTTAQARWHLIRVAIEAVANASDELRAAEANVVVINLGGVNEKDTDR
jgi:hypothetical protein